MRVQKSMNKLDDRLKKILWLIVQSHIDLNTPIGSILIAKRFPLGLSPATIRNTMAKLEEKGYITQPHTSAGRVPTEKGYTLYVNTLLDKQLPNINSDLSYKLSEKLRYFKKDNNILIKEAARSLSSFSSYLALATAPKIEDFVFQRIKFVKYEQKKVLTFLISEDTVIKHKMIELDRIHSQKELDRAAGFLNSKFSGLTIKKMKEKISFQLYKKKVIRDELIANLLFICKDIIPNQDSSIAQNEFAGTSNLPDFATMNQIKEILGAIEENRFMLKLLSQIDDSKGTRVFVGMEKFIPSMKEFSLVISAYSDNNLANGAVGIIGPTRMNYRKLIPVVDHTARALTKILSGT